MVMTRIFPFAETTGGITVRVAPRYLPEQSDPEREYYVWAYHVRVENHGPEQVQLLARRWVITDGHGRIDEIEGDGVVGVQPVIGSGHAYDYVSGCPLPTRHGVMQGVYFMCGNDGARFSVAIPAFSLEMPESRPSVH